MLINLRNALMTGKRLPYDAEVEYLESTGNSAWIDSGIPNTANISATATAQCPSSSGTLDMYLFGSGWGANRSAVYGIVFSDYWSANGNCMLMTRGGTGASFSPSMGATIVGDGKIHSFTYTATDASSSISVDGGTAFAITTTRSADGTTYGIFGPRNQGTTSGTARLYALKIYDANNVLIRDYIPVRKGTVGYLYDRVSGKLFGNAGTGDFVLGQDVVPVEYILQTGTQYIDTLYPMADTRREVITVDWSGHSTTYREFMAGAASGSYLIELSANGYYGTAPTNLSSIQVSQKDRIRWDYTVGSAPSLYINDVFAINDTLVRVPTGNVMTGGIGTSGVNYPKMKIYSLDVYTDNSVQVRKMLPVRVGTGSTWEGAMMDVLTRRIYRNAGTGAFTYGNDLKYPIPAS